MRPSFNLFCNLTYDKPTIAAEIGVRHGDNALDMVANHKNLELFLIDSFKESDCPDAEFTAREKLSNYSHRVNFFVEESESASKFFRDKLFDYVYIDADHTYESVIKDLTNWWPKVKDTGILAGHDYNMPSVEAAVRDFLDETKVLFLVDDRSDGERVDFMIFRRR